MCGRRNFDDGQQRTRLGDLRCAVQGSECIQLFSLKKTKSMPFCLALVNLRHDRPINCVCIETIKRPPNKHKHVSVLALSETCSQTLSSACVCVCALVLNSRNGGNGATMFSLATGGGGGCVYSKTLAAVYCYTIKQYNPFACRLCCASYLRAHGFYLRTDSPPPP